MWNRARHGYKGIGCDDRPTASYMAKSAVRTRKRKRGEGRSRTGRARSFVSPALRPRMSAALSTPTNLFLPSTTPGGSAGAPSSHAHPARSHQSRKAGSQPAEERVTLRSTCSLVLAGSPIMTVACNQGGGGSWCSCKQHDVSASCAPTETRYRTGSIHPAVSSSAPTGILLVVQCGGGLQLAGCS